MLQEQRLWILISLKLSGEASIEELEELEGFLSTDPDLARKVEMLQKLWKSPNHASTQPAEQSFEKHFQRLNNQLLKSSSFLVQEKGFDEVVPVAVKPRKKYNRLWWGVVAASVLSLWLLFKGNEEITPKLVNNTVSTKPGLKTSINLPDGSKVWLNADSKITYDGSFEGKTREVYLSGEAFFDVAKDKSRPFIIHTKTINLKVLGTAFNVRSYDTDKESETSLVHGSVEVTLRNNPDKKIVLKPGEKLLVKNLIDTTAKHLFSESNDEEQPIAVLTNMHYYGNDSSAVETSWTKNELVFNNERLDKIVLNLERWFKIKMIIKDESLKKERYKITIEEEDKLEDVLEALKTAEGFHYSIRNKEVIINR
jgi:transmembrane sensor